MKKICYLSYEAFFTADKTVLPILASSYDVTFYFIQSTPSIVSQSELSQLAEEAGVKVLVFKPAGRLRSPLQLLAYRKLFKAVRAQDPDVLFITPAHNIYLALLAPLVFNRSKSVIAYHDVLPHLNETNFLKDLSQDLFKYSFKNFHFYSKTQMQIFSGMFADKNYSYAPLIINDKGFNALPEKHKSDNVRFLFFGNIRYYKGLDLLIQAAEGLYAHGVTNFKVTVAGQGDHWEYCKSLIKHPHLFDLHIGFIDEREVPELFSNADYLILPYRDVTQSGPLALSHTFNIPAIASSHDGFSEHIADGYNGYIFKNEDVGRLAAVMGRCCELSEQKYEQLRNNLINYTQTMYDPQKVLGHYQAVFEKL